MKLKRIINNNCLINQVCKRYLVKEIRQWAKGLVPDKLETEYTNNDLRNEGNNECRDKILKNIQEG